MSRNSELKAKAPKFLVIAIIILIVAYLLLDFLDDTIIEGGAFESSTLGMLLSGLGSFTMTVINLVSSWGYIGIFALMLLEASSLPIPSEAILPFSGYLVSMDMLSFWPVILISTAAGLLGSTIDYYIGMKGMGFLERTSLSKTILDSSHIETAEKWLKKYGAVSIILSRMIPGFRTVISFPAGALKMPFVRFTIFTTIGCFMWDLVLVYSGLFLGAHWREIAFIFHYLLIGVVSIIVLAVVIFLIWRRKNKISQNKT